MQLGCVRWLQLKDKASGLQSLIALGIKTIESGRSMSYILLSLIEVDEQIHALYFFSKIALVEFYIEYGFVEEL